jgi:5-methylcytosine-specific restriction protein A
MPRPDWTRDELILALDLYLREPAARSNKNHPGVIELSRTLNSLPIHGELGRESDFRNANGVAMKLGNFLRFDPDYKGAGLSRGNRLEEEVWSEFASDPNRLTRVAASIRLHIGDSLVEELAVDEAEAIEGALLTRVHHTRERSAAIVRRKKAAVLQRTGVLECEACEFDFANRYGALGEGFAEVHHLVPLSELTPSRRTRLSDLAVVCANCHRMIHRRRPWLSIDELRATLAMPRN